MSKQEVSVAFLALSIDHLERRKLSSWKLCDGDLIFDTTQLARFGEHSREFIDAALHSDHPNGLQILELMKIC